MLLFININKVGITWVRAAAPPPEPCVAASGLEGLVQAAANCQAVVAWDAKRQLAALARSRPELAALPAIELDQPRPSQEYNAEAALATYYAVGDKLFLAGSRPIEEQWRVFAAARQGRNLLCRAAAGTGKSTTLLLCAAGSPRSTHVLLTYNKRLQLEVAQRAGPNVAVLTYHAAAGRAYGRVVRNDEQMRACVRAPPDENAVRFDVLLVDEAQDMTVEYFALVRHLLAANRGASLIVVGDELQAINAYRGAHVGFLTEAPSLYRGLVSSDVWAECRLSESHRLTPATASFVNTQLYNAPLIVGSNRRDTNRLPLYMAGHGLAGKCRQLVKAVKSALAEYGPEGIFVLAASVRNVKNPNSPLAQLVRKHLVGVPTFIARRDEEQVDEGLLKGKLAILSFNASKGCERPCVILLGFDETYFEYYDKAWSSPGLPNVLTVAATRARALLVIVADAAKTLRTINLERLGEYAEVLGAPRRSRPSIPEDRESLKTVTELVQHLHPALLQAALERALITLSLVSIPRACPAFARHVKFGDGLTEDVSFIYGTLATVVAEVARSGGSAYGTGVDIPVLVKTSKEKQARMQCDLKGFYMTLEEHRAYPAEFWERISGALAADPAERQLAEWAAIVVAVDAFRNGRHHTARQMKNYEWVSADALKSMGAIVARLLQGRPGVFEKGYKVTIGTATITGYADFVDTDTSEIWEFKLGELCQEHELQLACYLALQGGGRGVLASILHCESREIVVDAEDALPLLTLLVERAPAPEVTVAELVAAFDAGGDVLHYAPGPGDATDPEGTSEWDVEDAY